MSRSGTSEETNHAFLQSWLPALLCLSIIVAFTALFLISKPAYLQILGLWSFPLTSHVFLDMEFVTAQIQCWNQGTNVYRINPCDLYGRVHVYSPLWLRFSILPPGYGWAKVLGEAQDVLFALSLTFLPRLRGIAAAALVILAVASPSVLFALERANVDVGLFVLTILGLACIERGGVLRYPAYGIFLLSGLLKYYPLVLFARALDERPRFFFILAILTGLSVAGLALAYSDEVLLALANVPVPSVFGDGFGARQFGGGMEFLLGIKGMGAVLTLSLTVLSCTLAWRLASQKSFVDAFHALVSRARSCLVAGALLFCGCYFMGSSVGYRGIVLLLVLPGLVLMAQKADEPLRRKLWNRAIAAVLALWNLVPIMAFGAKAPMGKALGPAPFLATWVCREALWWIILVVLLATIIRFALSSTMAGWASGLAAGRTAPAI